MTDSSNRKIFLIATENAKSNAILEDLIKSHFPQSMVYSALGGAEALFKFENAPPHVVILDSNLQKVSARELTEKIIRRKDRAAVIILSPTETPEEFMDHVATGQVQYLSGSETITIFPAHLNRALNWVIDGSNPQYRLRILKPGESLINAGEAAEHVYLVKSGELKAFKRQSSGNEIILGNIGPGEFVGEMAYINGEARSANVVSLSACELIEISNHCLDAVLFSKPAWSKALMKTLSKRLKSYNDVKS